MMISMISGGLLDAALLSGGEARQYSRPSDGAS
jgi:hypothetical protein